MEIKEQWQRLTSILSWQHPSQIGVGMTIELPQSVSQIARAAGVPRHRVQYLLTSRGIEPTGRIGQAVVFDATKVRRILSELRRIECPARQTIRARYA